MVTLYKLKVAMVTPNVTEERYTCPVCDDKFYDEVELQAHLYSHKRIFPCEICREVFSEHR